MVVLEAELAAWADEGFVEVVLPEFNLSRCTLVKWRRTLEVLSGVPGFCIETCEQLDTLQDQRVALHSMQTSLVAYFQTSEPLDPRLGVAGLQR